jgi:hypothetical protein
MRSAGDLAVHAFDIIVHVPPKIAVMIGLTGFQDNVASIVAERS